MANKNLFSSTSTSRKAPVANAVNNAGGIAYNYEDKHLLAQLAATNCFNGTFYVTAANNLELAKKAVSKLRHDPKYLAQVALYCRNKAYMKDMPAFLVAALAGLDMQLFRKVFPKVIDDGKMLRNFMQIGRSGEAGKILNMSSGGIRNAIREWFDEHSSDFIFRASIGNNPSMRDMLRMSRPRPSNKEKAALFAYLKGAEFDKKTGSYVTYKKDNKGKSYVAYSHSFDSLPIIVQNYERFKESREGEIPNVDFRMLDSFLSKEELKQVWRAQALKSSWKTTRMNLNNFLEYGVFQDQECITTVANRLADPKQIAKAKAYPYQLLMAYLATDNIPFAVREALQDAMEVATANVPSFEGKIYICVDTSRSMRNPITGKRDESSSKARCVDVASLFAASLLRTNKSAEVIPFDTRVHPCNLNPRDSIMTNATKLAAYGGGGTSCSIAINHLNVRDAKGDAIILISDNESWLDNPRKSYFGNSDSTQLMNEWQAFKQRNRQAKLVCIDLTPAATSQTVSRKDILQIGGFGDSCFDLVDSFIRHGSSADHWVSEIEKIEI